MSVSEVHEAIQRAMAAGGKGSASGAITRQQIIDALRQVDDVAAFDEGTGVVRPARQAAIA